MTTQRITVNPDAPALPDGRYYEVHVTQWPRGGAPPESRKDWIDYRGPDVEQARARAARVSLGFSFGPPLTAAVYECADESAGLDWYGRRPI